MVGGNIGNDHVVLATAAEHGGHNSGGWQRSMPYTYPMMYTTESSMESN